ncbi:hypothetical protein [Roseburia sp. 1XD42-69]|uniref:hypothetical protein n=1 Tax=Roseburia sp. 1XD42-69 TaxID=2320088 RepID=UPI000EA090CA|nr:hypothetical protein [Roseburia sp. 1XD42-69]MCX4320455.1 hypothetical protein [Lachnospiraceae bacterium]RKJ66841.1 hypothetical protein D7Y06_06815 [Roseburia sp. 1XD42-69]
MNLKLSGTSPVRVTVTGRDNGVGLDADMMRGLADDYIIYAAPCNTKGKKSSLKKVKTKASGGGGQYTQKGLKSGTWYKYRIDAYRNEDGRGQKACQSHWGNDFKNESQCEEGENPSSLRYQGFSAKCQ